VAPTEDHAGAGLVSIDSDGDVESDPSDFDSDHGTDTMSPVMSPVIAAANAAIDSALRSLLSTGSRDHPGQEIAREAAALAPGGEVNGAPPCKLPYFFIGSL
jgi:hypothetical protein